MNHRTEHTINGIIGAAEHLTTLLPAAIAILTVDIPDGYGRDRSYDKVRGTGGGSTVESAVLAHDDESDDNRHAYAAITLREINDELNAAVLILANLRTKCVKIAGQKTEVERCTSTGREGALEWHDADCWDAPIRRGLCAKHYQKERRWRLDHGLPTRDTEAA